MDTITITTTAAHAKVHRATALGGAPLCQGAKATSCRPTDRAATCRKCIRLAKQPEPEIAAALAAVLAARAAHLRNCEEAHEAFSRVQMLRSHVAHCTPGDPFEVGLPSALAQLEAAEARHAELSAQWDHFNAIGTEALNAFRAMVHGKGQRVRDYLPEYLD